MRPILCLSLIAVFLSGIFALPARAIPPKNFDWFALPNYEPGMPGLRRAIENGDILSVARLLDRGVKINEVDQEHRETPLILAIRHNHLPIIQLLANRGANVNFQYEDDWTVLDWAAYFGNPAVLKLLLERGAKVSVNVLNLAAQNSNTEGVRLLLDQGAYPNRSDSQGRTPLMGALNSGEKEMVSLLLDRGANPNLQDFEGWTPLMLTATGSLSVRSDSLLPPRLPLQYHLDVLRILIAKRAGLNIRNNFDQTALIVAISRNEEELVGALIKAGASTKGANEARLFCAVADGNRKEVLRLLAVGVNPNLRRTITLRSSVTLLIETLLMRATEKGDAYIVRALLAKGAEVNVREDNDQTALFQAVGKPEIARMLLDAGANIHLIDSEGDTAFTYALTAGHGHPEVIRMLLDRWIDVNGKRGLLSYLTWAAKYGNIGAVNVLLERGADVNAKDSNDDTVLHHAIMYRHEEKERVRPILEALLNKGAKINASNRYGITPLMLALEKATHLNPQDIQFLRDRGAIADSATPDKDDP